MRSAKRVLAWSLAVVLAVLLVGPFLIPIPPLTDTSPPAQLADADSRFVTVEGVDLHYKQTGDGDPAIILLHGFGASIFSWREVVEPLATIGTVIAYDRPSSGLTERPLPGAWKGKSPYGPQAQVDQLLGLMDVLGVEEAILIGNSAGGTIALNAALQQPERVRGLVLVDAAIYTTGGAPSWLRPLLRTPQLARLGPLFVRSIRTRGEQLLELAWHDPSRITPEIRSGYTKPLSAQDWDRGLWELTVAGRDLDLEERLQEVGAPTLVITGDDDRIVPTAESIRLAGDMPAAELVVIPACGHVPQEECPEAFLSAVETFIARL